MLTIRRALAGAFLLFLTLFAEPYDPNLGTKIDSFLSGPIGLNGQSSPIAGNGSTFVSNAVSYNVDPRLIVAIAGAETQFGTNWGACKPSGFNAWSWFFNGVPCSKSSFTSYAQGIQYVTSGIRRLYLNKGLTTIPAIAGTYCASGCGSWIPSVTGTYARLGGDVSDLTYSTTLIDFEQFTGPCCFTGVQPPLTVGSATVSGGQILSGTSYLPADQSVIYGTAFFCSGCSTAITITFSRKISNFSVFLYNGLTDTVTYTVQDDQGGSQSVTLASNAESGTATVSLLETGISQVTISGMSGGEWDFFVDNIRFAPQGP